MKCKVNIYRYDISDEEQASAYEALRGSMTARCFRVHDTRVIKYPHECEIDTRHLFKDQLNTKCGKRLHFWYEQIVPNKRIRPGYFLELPDEYYRLLDTRLQCGFCGKQYDEPTKDGYCTACTGSEYLEYSDYPSLKLLPVSSNNDRSKEVLPVPVLTRINASMKIAMKERRRKKVEYLKSTTVNTIENLKIKLKGFTWLLENTDIDVDNVIMYNQGVFTIGWREPLTCKQQWRTEAQLTKFPFKYEIKGDAT
jgi:hypothetical protein